MSEAGIPIAENEAAPVPGVEETEGAALTDVQIAEAEKIEKILLADKGSHRATSIQFSVEALLYIASKLDEKGQLSNATSFEDEDGNVQEIEYGNDTVYVLTKLDEPDVDGKEYRLGAQADIRTLAQYDDARAYLDGLVSTAFARNLRKASVPNSRFASPLAGIMPKISTAVFDKLSPYILAAVIAKNPSFRALDKKAFKLCCQSEAYAHSAASFIDDKIFDTLIGMMRAIAEKKSLPTLCFDDMLTSRHRVTMEVPKVEELDIAGLVEATENKIAAKAAKAAAKAAAAL